MPDRYTLAEFGQRIKAKYPQYKDLADEDIASKVLAKYPQYKSSIKANDPSDDVTIAPNGPEDRTVGNYLGEAVSGVGRGLMNDVSGIGQMVMHPNKTIEEGYKQADAADAAAAKEWRDLKGTPLLQRMGATALTGLENAPMIGGMVQHAEEGGERMGSPEAVGAAAEGITTFAAPELAGKGIKTVADLRSTLKAKYGPKAVDIAGEKVPVLAGEANPESPAGRLQERLKRSGSAQPKFEAVEKAQQEAVKNVIRNTAKQTSQLTGPISEEPGSAMRDATTATFQQGRAMYDALDGQLKGYSAPLNSASKVVQDAVTRARKLGVDVDASADSVLFDGKKITPKDNPGLWQKLHEQGIVDAQGNGTPLAAYKSVYSQLLKMQRSASDEAVRYNIGQEIKAMDANMQSALKGTPIYDNWKAADQVWAKAYALRDVSDAIEGATKGTPAAQQAPGMAPVPTKLQGASLVDKLNTLAENGILRKAFTPEEAKNLRQSADILDRIQRTPTGKGFGESLNRSRGLAHAVSGAKGPLVGAGVGGVVGLLSGSPIIGAEAGAGLGFLVQAIGERSLVRIMTDTKGMQALDSYAKAKTLPARMLALRKLATLSASTGARKYDVQTGTDTGASPKVNRRDEFMVVSNPKGLIEKGNLPIWNRPSVNNADGSHSSELSISQEDEQGREVLVPTIVNGKFLTPDGKMPPLPPNGKYPDPGDKNAPTAWKAMWKAAWRHYEKTGENLGKFDNPDDADDYAGKLHRRGDGASPNP